MSGWTIRQWRLPRPVLDALDARADHYRVTHARGWRIIWLGYGAPDDEPDDGTEPVWLPVAMEKVTIHG